MTDVGRLSEALVAAQAEMPRLVKDEQADTGKFKYRYLSLQALLEQVLPVLNRHGLALIQAPTYFEGVDLLWTHVRHVSGDEVKAAMRIPVGDPGNAQAYGSALSYARRYAVLAFLGLAPDEDDDGAKASGAARTRDNPSPPVAAPEDPPKILPPNLPGPIRQNPPPGTPAGPPDAASGRPADPATLRVLKETVETLQKGFPSPDPTHSYWDDVRAYMIGQFAKNESKKLTETEAQELVLHMEKRLIEAGQGDEVPFG